MVVLFCLVVPATVDGDEYVRICTGSAPSGWDVIPIRSFSVRNLERGLGMIAFAVIPSFLFIY
jgi:hypothetical protein